MDAVKLSEGLIRSQTIMSLPVRLRRAVVHAKSCYGPERGALKIGKTLYRIRGDGRWWD